MMKSWIVRCAGESCVVVSQTLAQAKYITMLSAKDAGINVEWTSLTGRRAKQFDSLALFRTIGPITPDVAEAMMQNKRAGG